MASQEPTPGGSLEDSLKKVWAGTWKEPGPKDLIFTCMFTSTDFYDVQHDLDQRIPNRRDPGYASQKTREIRALISRIKGEYVRSPTSPRTTTTHTAQHPDDVETSPPASVSVEVLDLRTLGLLKPIFPGEQLIILVPKQYVEISEMEELADSVIIRGSNGIGTLPSLWKSFGSSLHLGKQANSLFSGIYSSNDCYSGSQHVFRPGTVTSITSLRKASFDMLRHRPSRCQFSNLKRGCWWMELLRTQSPTRPGLEHPVRRLSWYPSGQENTDDGSGIGTLAGGKSLCRLGLGKSYTSRGM